MHFKEMTDSELANVMVNYINRTEHLRAIIARYLDGTDCGCISAQRIKEEYKNLKSELRNDADYLDLVRNRGGSALYAQMFSPSIREAAAFGFTVSTNGAINHAMYSAVEEALYKLTKRYNLNQWGDLI